MKLSDFLMNTLSMQSPRAHAAVRLDAGDPRSPATSADGDLLRCKLYRRAFRMTEVAVPAALLGNPAVGKWARDHEVAVDVRCGADLASAVGASIRLSRVTVFADGMSESELRAVADLGVGHVVADSVWQVEVLRSVVSQRRQDVVIRMTDAGMPLPALKDNRPCGFRFDSNESDAAVAAVIGHSRLNLVGLHCEVGTRDDDFVSYPAAIGHMVAEMAQVRRNHGVLLTRLGLGGGRAIPAYDWPHELHQLAVDIDGSLDDSCGTLRYPRPLVVLSAGLAVPGRSAA